jgi:hypothetical protein
MLATKYLRAKKDKMESAKKADVSEFGTINKANVDGFGSSNSANKAGMKTALPLDRTQDPVSNDIRKDMTRDPGSISLEAMVKSAKKKEVKGEYVKEKMEMEKKEPSSKVEEYLKLVKKQKK